MSTRMRDWCELTRISNLPTVLSSTLVGIFMLMPLIADPVLILGVVLPVILAIACFYLGGFVMNDVFDVEIDRVERPGRPLPSGRISMLQASRAGTLLLGVGLILILVAELVNGNTGIHDRTGFSIQFPYGLAAAGVLVALILLYDGFHTRGPAWVLVMGGCRGLVYITCLLTVTDQLQDIDPHPLILKYLGWPNLVSLPVVPFVVSMILYVACFSRIARGEVTAKGDGTLYCYRCGASTERDATSCEECGRSIEAEVLARSTSPPMPLALRNLCLAGTLLPLAALVLVKLAGGMVALSRGEGLEHSALVRSDLLIVLISSAVVAIWFLVAIRAYVTNPLAPRKPIQMWIAGIALLDGLYLFLYGQGILSVACFLLFAFTIWGHRRIRGT